MTTITAETKYHLDILEMDYLNANTLIGLCKIELDKVYNILHRIDNDLSINNDDIEYLEKIAVELNSKIYHAKVACSSIKKGIIKIKELKKK